MTAFVRNLVADLVAKRLWPVAAALVIAIVAIPVVLVAGAEDPPVSSTVAGVPGTPAQPGQPAVGVAEERSRGGRGPIGRNPFEQPKPKTAKAPAPSTSPTGIPVGGISVPPIGGGGGLPDIGGLPGGASGGDDSWGDVAPVDIPGLDDVDPVPVGGGTGSKPKGDGDVTDAKASWHVDLRFGREGQMAERSDVPRLTPLPSTEDPFFVFMGVLADGKTALFLVSSDAVATGDGKCLPTPQNCERVEMRAGQTEFFDVTTPEGETVQYQLDVKRVSRRTTADSAVAAAARTRESTEGRQVLRSAVSTGQVEVSDLAYSRDLGLVVPSGARTQQPGSLFGGFRVDLRFGAPGQMVKRYNLARLTPLPSVDVPSFVYLGVLSDGESALFLNPTEAAASGDAVCLPSPEECQRIQLKAGQTGVLSAPTLNGQAEEYEIAVDGISKVEAATAEEARASIERESPAGRRVLRRLITEVGSLVSDLSYSDGSGALEPAAKPGR